MIKRIVIAIIRFTCPTARINQYHARKKKYLRSKFFTSIFTCRRELYADPMSDVRRAR